jgi:hypothetical protein
MGDAVNQCPGNNVRRADAQDILEGSIDGDLDATSIWASDGDSFDQTSAS